MRVYVCVALYLDTVFFVSLALPYLLYNAYTWKLNAMYTHHQTTQR